MPNEIDKAEMLMNLFKNDETKHYIFSVTNDGRIETSELLELFCKIDNNLHARRK